MFVTNNNDMKTNITFFTFLLSGFLFVSCLDNDTDVATCSDGIQNGTETGIDCGGDCQPCADLSVLSGDLTRDLELEADIEYSLTGALVVKAPYKLTIPRGTTIKATGGTSAYIAVEQGAKIYVDGSADSPVVMTSGSDNPQAGDWGGLVIAGKAPDKQRGISNH